VNEAGLKGRNVDWANRIPFYREQCRDCYAIGICGGGCIFDGEAIYGRDRFDERNCHFTRKLLEHFIWDIRDELGDMAVDSRSVNEKYCSLLRRTEGTLLSVGHETV
jgi:sulfatase maturation enzyme AslB (radical SAM superfamily)